MDADEDPSSGDELGITEQVLIDHVDILFQTSDVEESGYVPVSRIIEYLRIHTSFGEVGWHVKGGGDDCHWYIDPDTQNFL